MTSEDRARRDTGPGERVLATNRAFTQAVYTGELDLPLPGRGQTRARWSALAQIAQRDLCLARLAEAHVDALAILSELHGPVPASGSRWGVWASHPLNPALTARREGDTWVLRGTKPWCSGARTCTHALVTADAPDGYRLFAVQHYGPSRDGHSHVHGASLGISGTAYCQIGGFPPLAVAEDHSLVTALSRSGCRIARPGGLPVVTSARRDPRADHGFGSLLCSLE
jgi:hypothetical protein